MSGIATKQASNYTSFAYSKVFNVQKADFVTRGSQQACFWYRKHHLRHTSSQTSSLFTCIILTTSHHIPIYYQPCCLPSVFIHRQWLLFLQLCLRMMCAWDLASVLLPSILVHQNQMYHSVDRSPVICRLPSTKTMPKNHLFLNFLHRWYRPQMIRQSVILEIPMSIL